MRKVIVLAVAGAFVSPLAFADSGNVTISGNIRAGYQYINGAENAARKNRSGSATDAAQNMIDGRVELKFSGTEDLGDGLSTVWGLTTRISADGSGQDETDSNRDGILGNREAFLGLKSASWGQIRLGNRLDNFNDGKHKGFDVYGGEFFGKVNADKNALRYDLPAFGKLTSSVRLNLGEDKTTTQSASNGYVLRADYDETNWDIGGAYAEQRSSGVKTKQYNLTAAYRFEFGLEIAGEYERTKKATDPDVKKESMVYVNYKTGNLQVGAEVGRAKNIKISSTDFVAGSKEKLYGFYARYNMSKRTNLFGEYISRKTNQTNAQRRNMLIVGLKHTF